MPYRLPYRLPKLRVPFSWGSTEEVVSIHDRLCVERTLFLFQKIEAPLVNKIIRLLLFLDFENETDIFFYINCRGGDGLPTISLYDTIEFLRSDVCTMAIGLAASGGSLILSGGTITKRIAFPRARIMIRQPVTPFFRGSVKEIQLEAEEMFQLRKTVAELYSQKTGQPIDVVQNDLERETFMSAKEAKDYGIIDTIVKEVEKNDI